MAHEKLDLLTLDDTKLAHLYEERIAPILRAHEVERRRALRLFVWRFAAVVGVGLIAGAFFGQQRPHFNFEFAALVGGLIIFGLFGFAYRPLAQVGQRVKA